MPKFSITAVGSGESKPANEMRWVNLSQLEDDPMNEEIYNTDGIEELAADIELNGLMQYPLVRFMPGGMYRIISGHRRVKALRLLAKQDKEQWKTIPVILDSDKDETSIAIKLISANAVNRHMTRREQFLQAIKLYELLTEQKEKENLPGRVRDMVAKKLNISSGSVGAFLQLANNLNGILLDYYLNGSMSKSAAIEASKLPDEEQDALIEAIEYGDIEPPQLLSADIIRAHFAKYFEAGESEPKEIESDSADESVSHSDTQEQEEKPKTWNPTSGWVQLPEERRLEIMRNVEKVGATDIEPCEQCHLGTNCVGCCKACLAGCGAIQGCHREQGAAYREQEKSVSHSDTQKKENAISDTKASPAYWTPNSGYVEGTYAFPPSLVECHECHESTRCQGCCDSCNNHCELYQDCAKKKRIQALKDSYGDRHKEASDLIGNMIFYVKCLKIGCNKIIEFAGGCTPDCPLYVDGACNLPDHYPYSDDFLKEARENNKQLDYDMARGGV